MIRLAKLEALGRDIRLDDAPELAISTWTLARESLLAGKIDEALRWMEYAAREAREGGDSVASQCETAVSYIAENMGEEELEKLWRKRYALSYARRGAELDAKGLLAMRAEGQRGRGANFRVSEEPDRYVLVADPCSTGGRMWRTRPLAVTKKAHPWSWDRVGVPYYCTHCAMFAEIIPTEVRGYPTEVKLSPKKPEDPCIRFFYKRPELIPEEYFTRIGKTKTIR